MFRHEHHWMYGHPWGGGFDSGPGILFSELNTLLLVALFIGLIWALMRLILPSIRPMMKDIFGITSTDISALEILRRRYASGEIDAVTFEQMRERLIASYQQESNGQPLDDYSYLDENWTMGYRNIYTPPASYRLGEMSIAEQEQHISEKPDYIDS